MVEINPMSGPIIIDEEPVDCRQMARQIVADVYDAAMAEHRAWIDYRCALNAYECGAAKYNEEEIDKLDAAHREAQDKLGAACRAAEEVERG